MYLKDLIRDDVFVPTEIKPLGELTGEKTRRGLDHAVISNGKIVNIVSKGYGHITNQLFFRKAEQMLIDAKLRYRKQTINRSDRSFVMEFIIDDQGIFTVKNNKDKILPMLRFKNSYDGGDRTSGHFGFYRQVCANGLHISQQELEFSIRRTKNNVNLIMPKLETLFDKFLDNDFFTINAKFSEMMETRITDTEGFVKRILESTNLFKFERSDKNPDPSRKARQVIDIMDNESVVLNEAPNLWLGYNAFNAVLHRKLNRRFTEQEKLDKLLFNTIYEMV